MSDDEEEQIERTQKAVRVIARAFARMARTADGKKALAYLDATFGWDEAGPPGAASEQPIHFWVGNRAVLKAAKDMISLGEKLSGSTKNDDDE